MPKYVICPFFRYEKKGYEIYCQERKPFLDYYEKKLSALKREFESLGKENEAEVEKRKGYKQWQRYNNMRHTKNIYAA